MDAFSSVISGQLTGFRIAFDKRPIGETGIDTSFIVWIAILVASVALFAWPARKTLDARHEPEAYLAQNAGK